MRTGWRLRYEVHRENTEEVVHHFHWPRGEGIEGDALDEVRVLGVAGDVEYHALQHSTVLNLLLH